MKLTLDEHGERVRELRADGMSYRSIAREFGVHHTTILDFVRRHFPVLCGQPNPAEVTVREMKILVFDIETRPTLAYVWRLFDERIGVDQIVEPGGVMCFAAKWLGEPLMQFYSDEEDGHEEMVRQAWTLLDAADAVIHYHGRRFDVPHLNREFLRLGLTPPSPYKQIDLCQIVKRQMRFPSNRLGWVAQELEFGGKQEHEGFKLWVKCMNGDSDAWQRMRTYNERDVQLTEDLYYRILPWITGHPSHGAFHSLPCCPNCGSSRLQRRGTINTKVSTYVRVVCIDCGKWSRESKRTSKTTIQEAV